MGFYIEVAGFLAAVIFFLLAFPVMVFVKLTGESVELEW